MSDHDAECEADYIPEEFTFTDCRCVDRSFLASRFKTGDRVFVRTVDQRGVVRGRKHGMVCVHFGTTDKREVWAWYDPAVLVREPDMVEVVDQ